eukprot:scaffold358112_cov47-Prasinocladus_malaysianus.AAC.1
MRKVGLPASVRASTAGQHASPPEERHRSAMDRTIHSRWRASDLSMQPSRSSLQAPRQRLESAVIYA